MKTCGTSFRSNSQTRRKKKTSSLGTRPVHFEVMKQELYAAWFLGTKLGPNCA